MTQNPDTTGDIATRAIASAASGGAWLEALSVSGAAVVVTDPRLPDDPIIYVNAAFEALTGYPADEALGRNCRFLQGEFTDPATRFRIRTLLADGMAVSLDIRNRRRNGEVFWNRLGISAIRDDAGAVVFRLATLVDVSRAYEPALADQDSHLQRPSVAEVQERLRTIQTVAGASGAWEWDIPAGRLVADARFASLYGLDIAQAAAGISTSAFFGPIHDEDRTRLRIAVAGMLHGAEVFARDYRVVIKGEIRWVSARGRTFFDVEDRPKRFAGVLTDITEQKRIEERLLLTQTAGGVGSFEYVDGFGTVTVSEQFCRLLGLRPSQSLPVRTINAAVHSDDGTHLPMLGHRAGMQNGGEPAEFRIRRADTGEERWLACRGAHRADAVGSVFTGVIYDITSLKSSEAALRRLTETLEEQVEQRTQERDRLWNLSRDLLGVIDPDGRLTATNPAWERLLGYRPAAIIGTVISDLSHPDDADAVVEHLTAAADRPAEFDMRIRTSGGSYRWVNWAIVHESDHLYAIGRDVTQRKQLEDQLRHSQKMEAVGQLTGGIAHDFNNMLTGILGGVELAQMHIADGELPDATRFLDAALQSGQRAAALTHRLLAFSRRQSLNSRVLRVSDLVLSMEDLFRRTLGERIELTIALEPELGLAIADENQLESAILNLIINARDAMPEGGQLIVGGRNASAIVAPPRTRVGPASNDFVEIFVTDTGVGMSPEVQQKALEPFYTTKPQGQGTGLGLSMVYGFVQQSQGDVVIESREGAGTTVRMFLPRHSGATEAPSVATRQAEPGKGETILLVEDDAAVRLVVMNVLRGLGYEVIETSQGTEALPELHSRAVDLLISDIGLPGMNGRQLADIARQSRPDLPVLLMTGYAKEAAGQASFLPKGMDIIRKPFSVHEFGERVQRILRPSLS